MRLRSREDRPPRPPNVVTWLGIAGLAATATRLLDELLRRHDAKLLADHEHARKLAKKARKKVKKAKKKIAKGKPPLIATSRGDGGSVARR
jgi:hypothetical protein